jgi:hypothetical protein
MNMKTEKMNTSSATRATTRCHLVDVDEGKKDELDESDNVLLRALCWVDNSMFLLSISTIRLI